LKGESHDLRDPVSRKRTGFYFLKAAPDSYDENNMKLIKDDFTDKKMRAFLVKMGKKESHSWEEMQSTGVKVDTLGG
jgi:hypothetical protein